MGDSTLNYYILLNLFGILSSSTLQPLYPECLKPLGMESKQIKDSAIRTGVGAVASGKEGYYARLHNDKAWCIPNIIGYIGSGEFKDNIYIEVTFSGRYKVSAMALQGERQYSYGEFVRISYEYNGQFYYYKIGSAEQLKVKGYVGDEIDYITFSPALQTNQIKIDLVSDSNTKCLRMEFYGCRKKDSSINEYIDCQNKSKPIITRDMPTLSFNATDYLLASYAVPVKLKFSKLDAWCIVATQENGTKIKQYAQIDLGKDMLVYGAQVRGYVNDLDTDKQSVKDLAYKFRLEFSVGNDWEKIEGGKIFVSKEYVAKPLTFSVPYLARYIRIYINYNYMNKSCIKLQLFGCSAISADDVPTTPFVLPTTNINETEAPDQTRVLSYDISQGNTYAGFTWTDTEYSRSESSNGVLSGGTGCLLEETVATDPFTNSRCWIGWNKEKAPNPQIALLLTKKAVVHGLYFHTYVNESMGAYTINEITISAEDVVRGKVCAPESFYHISPQGKDFKLSFNNIYAQKLTINLKYAGDWILIRRIKVLLGEVKDGLPLVDVGTVCTVPIKAPVGGENNSPSTIIIIVCVILGLLFLGLLAFIIYHYRKGLHKVILKSKGNSIIVETSFDRQQKHMLLRSRSSEKSDTSLNVEANGKVEYARVCFESAASSTEDVYAAPDVVPTSPNKPTGYTQVTIQDYAQYTHPDLEKNTGQNGILEYAKPVKPQQYALPNSAPKTNPIYQGSVIYATGYESPYKAVLGSSLYCEPEKVVKKKSYKIFPREQLNFKEQIGTGQFGEVWIAEASGLEVIYDTIGHYNSWGLADTGKVAVKKLKDSVDKEVEGEFMKEVEVMSQLTNENVVRLLGICNERSPLLMVVEYMENGDLNQFLNKRKPCDMQNFRASQMAPDILSMDTLIHMSSQIAAGLKYLHSEGFIHRDLATRNCLVGPAFQVKISDFGMSRYLYSKHYYRVEGRAVLPIRWMAPECLFYGKFTATTDVWSFGVTLWEIFSFAKYSPYENLSDSEVIEKACEAVQNPRVPFKYLEKPGYCTADIYAEICKCWQKLPEDRPTVNKLFKFFKDLSEMPEETI